MRLVLAFSIAVAIPLAGLSAHGRLAHPGSPGPYAIGHTSFLVVDQTRNADSVFGGRPLPVNVWYPADPSGIGSDTPEAVYLMDPIYGRWPASTSSEWEQPCRLPQFAEECPQFGLARAYEDLVPSPDGPFPIVVFSPGWGNRYLTYMFYAERLASHGFVVAVLQHYRDGSYGWDINPVTNSRDPFEVAMFNRPRDVSFALTTLLDRNDDPNSTLFKSMRPELVAASGHSIGGYAALALAAGDQEVCVGTTFDANPRPSPCTSIGRTDPDRRFQAIVTLDASNANLYFHELAKIRVPAMTLGEPVETAGVFFPARQHAAMSGHPNYRVDVRNALHQSFTTSCAGVRVAYSKGISNLNALENVLKQPYCTTALPQLEVNRLAAQYTIAFLNTQFGGETAYRRVLTPGWALTRETDIDFFVVEPRNRHGNHATTFAYFLHQPGSEAAGGGVNIGSAERDPLPRSAAERSTGW